MRRFHLLLVTVIVLSLSSSNLKAQNSSANLPELDAARRDARQAWEELQRLQGKQATASQAYSESSRNMQNSAASYNSMADQLSARTPTIGMKTDFFNDVVSLRKKDDLDKWVDQKRAEWVRSMAHTSAKSMPITGLSIRDTMIRRAI